MQSLCVCPFLTWKAVSALQEHRLSREHCEDKCVCFSKVPAKSLSPISRAETESMVRLKAWSVLALRGAHMDITPEQEQYLSLTPSPRGALGLPFTPGGTTPVLCHSRESPSSLPDTSPVWKFCFPAQQLRLKPHLQLHRHFSPLMTPVLALPGARTLPKAGRLRQECLQHGHS